MVLRWEATPRQRHQARTTRARVSDTRTRAVVAVALAAAPRGGQNQGGG